MPPLHGMPADAPPWLQATITLFLLLHVGAGSVAIVSGFGAILVRKGAAAHRLLGRTFFASMLTMAFMGSTLAAVLKEPSNIIGGALAFYLVVTGWATIRRKERRLGATEIVSCIAALVATGVLIALGIQPGTSTGARGEATLYMVFGVLAALFTALDLKVIMQGGVTGWRRVARHLWRMCFALFFASGSFFLGQQKVMPIWLQGSPVLFLPALTPLALMMFWLLRVRLNSRAGRPSTIAVPVQTN